MDTLLRVDLGLQHTDIGQVAVFFIVVKGVQLASGQSVTVFKQILQNLGYNPVEAMENTINSERYDCITVE